MTDSEKIIADYKDAQQARIELFQEGEITEQQAQEFVRFLTPYAEKLKIISQDLQQTLYVLRQAPEDIQCDINDACVWTLDTVNALENLQPDFKEKVGYFLSQFAEAQYFNIDDVLPYEGNNNLNLIRVEA